MIYKIGAKLLVNRLQSGLSNGISKEQFRFFSTNKFLMQWELPRKDLNIWKKGGIISLNLRSLHGGLKVEQFGCLRKTETKNSFIVLLLPINL